jgi:hypothetical protein
VTGAGFPRRLLLCVVGASGVCVCGSTHS